MYNFLPSFPNHPHPSQTSDEVLFKCIGISACPSVIWVPTGDDSEANFQCQARTEDGYVTVSTTTLIKGQIKLQSTPPPPPPNTAVLGTGKKAAVLEMAVKGVKYNQEKRIRDLEISSGFGGEAVKGGAELEGTTVKGIGGEAVKGGAVLEGTTVKGIGGEAVKGGAVLEGTTVKGIGGKWSRERRYWMGQL